MSTAVKSIPAGKVKPKGIVQTSVGMKIMIAITGSLLIGFVLAHMLGHLQMFAGQDRYNAYAKGLQNLGPLLWLARIGLLVIFVTHLGLAIKVTRINRAARPVPYHIQKTQVASFASRTMVLTGLVILAFVVTNPEYANMKDSLGRADVYGVMVIAFNNPIILVSYIVAVLLLSLHLSHGLFSVLQTLGLNHPTRDAKVKLISNAFAVFIFVGYASVPVAIAAGIIK
jgi:succinate dehydrogenase / fumarate reductase cytochrome b subunit